MARARSSLLLGLRRAEGAVLGNGRASVYVGSGIDGSKL